MDTGRSGVRIPHFFLFENLPLTISNLDIQYVQADNHNVHVGHYEPVLSNTRTHKHLGCTGHWTKCDALIIRPSSLYPPIISPDLCVQMMLCPAYFMSMLYPVHCQTDMDILYIHHYFSQGILCPSFSDITSYS